MSTTEERCPTISTTPEELRTLGLTSAASKLEAEASANTLREQYAVAWAEAYARYPFVTPAQMEAFERRCEKEMDPSGRMKKLRLVTLASYTRGVPPAEALAALKEAQAIGLFETFEVAYIEWVKPVPDPIIFGKIKGNPDRFVIAQWDHDVSYQEIVAAKPE